MNKQHNDYKVVPYSKVRRVMAVTLRSAQRTPLIHGLLEVDVTRAREFLRDHKAKTGESLSFTAFIITCLAHAVAENKAVQACRKGSKHLVLFDEVDVATAIERDMAGQKQPIIYIIRAANTKTFREIHHEIRAAQVKAVEQAWEGFKGFALLPLLVFTVVWPIFWWLLGRFPHVQKTYGGTVGLTAVGMFGKGSGWGIPVANRTQITLGGITEKPGVVDSRIAIRDYLSMTLSFDHAIIDGALAARFTQRLKELIESGYGLAESEAEKVGSLSMPRKSPWMPFTNNAALLSRSFGWDAECENSVRVQPTFVPPFVCCICCVFCVYFLVETLISAHPAGFVSTLIASRIQSIMTKRDA